MCLTGITTVSQVLNALFWHESSAVLLIVSVNISTEKIKCDYSFETEFCTLCFFGFSVSCRDNGVSKHF